MPTGHYEFLIWVLQWHVYNCTDTGLCCPQTVDAHYGNFQVQNKQENPVSEQKMSIKLLTNWLCRPCIFSCHLLICLYSDCSQMAAPLMSALSFYMPKLVISRLSNTSQQNNPSGWTIMSGYHKRPRTQSYPSFNGNQPPLGQCSTLLSPNHRSALPDQHG